MEQKSIIIEERELSIAQYLAAFPEGTLDYKLVKEKSENLESILIKIVEEPSGRRFEDTTFKEKSGITYTVRAAL